MPPQAQPEAAVLSPQESLARNGIVLPKPRTGHWDELRGNTQALNTVWSEFFAQTGALTPQDLNQQTQSLQRQIQDNGVTYNVYADQNGFQRPWSLDLFPWLIESQDWQHIEAGVLQRVTLLEQMMADTYGAQQLLQEGLIPPALVHGHPGYVRALQGVKPVGGTYLHIAAFDLARGQDGSWWLMSQRCQAPSGLGYLLENRLAIAAEFPSAFQAMRVQRLAQTYRALVDNLKRMSPAGADAHLVLLTPGPYNETYFEHVYLARYLGLTLVEGSDLLVRHNKLYLKTLSSLVPVHGLLKRLDDGYLDPLELQPESTLGVPGLLQAIRAGNVLVANMPGSAWLESPALLGFLPALCQRLLGESLKLPSLPTWWCGERAVMDEALAQLPHAVIKPTYPDPAGQLLRDGAMDVMGVGLSSADLLAWADRIRAEPQHYTLQQHLPLSHLPTWQAGQGASRDALGQVVPRAGVLRVFAVCDGPGSWRVLPGGLARLAGPDERTAAMQRGGSSADVWVLSSGEVDEFTLRPSGAAMSRGPALRQVTSRAAENMFWLGRYTERADNTIRLARLILESLSGDDATSPALMNWLTRLAQSQSLVLGGVPSPLQARRVFERALIAGLSGSQGLSVGFNLGAIRHAAFAVRERLSLDQWRVIVSAHDEVQQSFAGAQVMSSLQAQRVLRRLSDHLAAITGAQADRMTRDDGWRLLSVGRSLERLGFLSSALSWGLEGDTLSTTSGFEAMVALFDSTITYHAYFQERRDLSALVDLLVLDRDNPRSLTWVSKTLRERLVKLGSGKPSGSLDWAGRCPDIDVNFNEPVQPTLMALLQNCQQTVYSLSDEISAAYFTHSVNQAGLRPIRS